MNCTVTVEERFWAKVDKRGPEECWEWTAGRRRFGYGSFGVTSTTSTTAHRMSWELHFGPIPKGMEVCHTCDNPPCVNPGHLFLGTHAENVRDMWAKGRGIPPPRRLGESTYNAKLTEDDVRHIRRSASSNQRLAFELGVSRMAIDRVRKGQTWAHVDAGASS